MLIDVIIKKSKNKIINAINKLILCFQIIFGLKKNSQYSLKKIENFGISSYPMILASKIDIMNIKVSMSGSSPEDRGYKSISSVSTQTTTLNESFTPKSKLFNKTVFKKAL